MDYSNFYKCSSFKVGAANYFTVTQTRSSWGPRIIPDFEFIYHVQGKGTYVETAGTRIESGPDDLLLIPPGVKHTYSCPLDLPTVISCIHFMPIGNPRRKPPAHKIPASDDIEILNLFRKCAREYDRSTPFSLRIISLSIAEILMRLSGLDGARRPAEPIKLKRAKEYLQAHFRSEVSRGDLAGYLDITPEYLNFLFRKHGSLTPLDYLHELRMREAKELLQSTPLSISEIARRVGFQDPLYFSRVFKKRIGTSPSRFGKNV